MALFNDPTGGLYTKVGTTAPKPGAPPRPPGVGRDLSGMPANPNALTPPPAPPPSTLTTEGANVGAAKLAADAQRKRALGGTLLNAAPATSVTPPVAGGTPRTLIGY